MFQSARIKLTFWYILIIAIICFLFSIAFYKSSTSELEHIKKIQLFRIENPREDLYIAPNGSILKRIEPNQLSIDAINEAEKRIALSLVIINLAILIISTLASYFLAGRTLKPIKEMVDEQHRFITDSSHELRTPLTSLKSEIEVNLRDKKLNLPQAKKLLQSNLEEVNNLQSLSDNLIKLTQYQKANTSDLFELVSLNKILVESIKKVSNLAKLKKIKIENLTNDKLFVLADKTTILEVFVILLDNAIKYSPPQTTIKMTSQKSKSLITINVVDQGVGIDKKDIPHLFDRFYRADKSRTKTDTPGYGLGLSIAKQIIEKHHGTIKIESMEKGTIFSVILPLKTPNNLS